VEVPLGPAEWLFVQALFDTKVVGPFLPFFKANFSYVPTLRIKGQRLKRLRGGEYKVSYFEFILTRSLLAREQ
jgi:hypothetical protein